MSGNLLLLICSFIVLFNNTLLSNVTIHDSIVLDTLYKSGSSYINNNNLINSNNMDKKFANSDTSKQEFHVNVSYTYNTINNPHDEIKEIEKIIKAHIDWAVNNKDKKTLFSTVIENEELFFLQPDSKSTIDGINELILLVNNHFMLEDFKAIRTEINDLRIHISPTLKTSWFSCILNDYNEFQGKPAVWENVRWTGVLEKVEGKWKIFQSHFSKAEDLIK